MIIKTDVVIIGGGPAGMSAALASAKNGSKTIIVERNQLGGILNQCIHSGFGLHYFNEELTGPEFAFKLEQMVKKEKNISIMTETFVTDIQGSKLTIINKGGEQSIVAKAVVLATGAREKTAANISLTGSRPSGVMTAGVAQKMVNIMGKLPGKEIVILGSGDIGLIMARRLTLEGAKVKAIFEINKTSSGLKRNILQCVTDFNIPLHFQTTISRVVGKDKIEGVYYASVDDKFNLVNGSEKFMPCDALILSVGLTPETDLLPSLKTLLVTNGAEIDEYYQTNLKGIFTCGNVLHIHDLVDNVCKESEQAGKCASLYAGGKLNTAKPVKVTCSNDLSYVVPAIAYLNNEKFTAKFRLKNKITQKNIVARSGNKILAKKFIYAATPGEMQSLEIDKTGATEDIILEVI